MVPMQKTIRITAVRAFYFDRAPVAPGTALVVPYAFGRELMSNNKAIAAPAEAPEAPVETPVEQSASSSRGRSRASA